MSRQILEGPNLTYSIPEKTLGQFVFSRCKQHGSRICQIDGTEDKSETYSSVGSRSTRVAIALQNKGITSKDVIAFCSSNTLDNTIPMIATALLGAKISNLDPSLSVRHTKHLLGLVEPKMVFVEEDALSLIEQSLVGTSFETEVVVFGKSDKYSVFSDLLKPQKHEDDFRPMEVDPSDVAVIFFSSGTTGLSKAICHTHASFLASVSIFCQATPFDRMLHFTNFYWNTASVHMFCCFERGTYRVFARNPTAEDIFGIIERYKVGTIFAVPIITYKLTSCESSHRYDTSSLTYVMCGGTPMATAQLLKVKSLFKSAYVGQAYGMTEVGLIAAMDPNLCLEANNLKSCGVLVPGFKLKIVDLSSEQPVGPHQNGEIRLISPSLMEGYYKLDSSQALDKAGFLKTGDVGYYDDKGYLYLAGRIKEMFKYQSWHIVPAAVEAVLQEHEAIKEAVVFGLPSGEEGEVPAACVVLVEGYSLSEEEIDTFLVERVADRERLRGGVTFMKTLPKTPTGKVPRTEIKDFVVNSRNSLK